MSRHSREGESGSSRPTSAGMAIAAWIAPGGEALAGVLAGERAHEVEHAWGWRLNAVGGERRAAAAAWASGVGASEPASLRELALAAGQVAIVLGPRAPGLDDLRLLLEGERIVVLHAGPSLADACALGDALERIRVVPSLRHAESLRASAPMLSELREAGGEQIGVTALSIRLRCAAGDRSVEALLAEACDVVASEFGEVESVVAVARPPLTGHDVRSLVTLIRDTAGRIGTVDCADSGGWSREIEWLGPGGRVRIDDGTIRRWSAAGEAMERLEVSAPSSGVQAAVESLRSLSLQRFGREDSSRHLDALAIAEAARLSARTGNPESPTRMHELAAKP